MEGKRAIVTGAGKGIGKAICEALIAKGCKLAAITRTLSDLDSLPDSVIKISVGDLGTNAKEGAERALKALGGCDYLVNNAGIAILKPLLELGAEDFDATMNVNCKAAMIFTAVVGAQMVAEGIKGSIVNISSKASMTALSDHTTYCMSKAALDMLTKMSALELGPHNIRCNSVNPTVVMTVMGRANWSDERKAGQLKSLIPLHRFAEVDEVVKPVLFLLSDDSSMITGTSMLIEGGFTHTASLNFCSTMKCGASL
eukprot:GEMP01035727.1.p3 GENE.GEMP01035727.1~~GEMP01035727.1.p3  ORF type:complete len:256 (+),score=55.92 GEMP01035727.1:187-954(+)